MGVYEMEEEHSPTDTSEDSLEVRVKPIWNSPSGNRKNKRKSLEPRKYNLDSSEFKRRRLNSTGSEERSPQNSHQSRSPSPVSLILKKEMSIEPISPIHRARESLSPIQRARESLSPIHRARESLSPIHRAREPISPLHLTREPISPLHLAPKKRFKFDAMRELQRLEMSGELPGGSGAQQTSPNPFRPWSQANECSPPTPGLVPHGSGIPFFLQGFHGEVPLALIPGFSAGSSLLVPLHQPVQDEPLSLVKEKKSEEQSLPSDTDRKPFHVEKLLETPRKPKPPSARSLSPSARSLSPSARSLPPLARSLPPSAKSVTIKSEPSSGTRHEACSPDDKSKQRNYKNLTRERRVEANARERQRVHTITSAFDTLQAAIPTEDENLKLSKLSVIKIATAYIMALSRMAGYDYTEDKSAPSVETVLKHCRETISNETKIKKRN